jgi:diaminopimelate decarboxylase
MKSKSNSSSSASQETSVSRPIDPTTFTPEFEYRAVKRGASADSRDGAAKTLFCEEVSLEGLAAATGTPAYVYSRASIVNAYQKLDRAFRAVPHSLCYAAKANGNLSVLRLLAKLGSKFDVVSGGEIARLRRVGVSGRSIVFSGVGKSREEIRDALEYKAGKGGAGIFLFNVESAAELDVLMEESARLGLSGEKRPSVSMRINPDVRAGGHAHISTGYRQHKFGVDWSEARRIYLAHKDSKWITWRGISAHIGSQILSVDPFRTALERVAECVRELQREGVAVSHLDFGGGLGIRYTDEDAPDVDTYAKAIVDIVKPLGCELLLEPGRWIVGPAGVLLTRVLYTKENGGKTFVIVDAAMNDLIRPVLYDARHAITKASLAGVSGESEAAVDVVGPVCETGDFLGRDVCVGDAKAGDLMVIWTTGAYGFSESSNYNARPRAAEVMVEGRKFRVIRERESIEDLWRGEE